MSSSGLIYAVIVGAWAAYLVPMWLRRQDELNEARPTERFSTAIRLLAGRSAMERRATRALGDEPNDESSDESSDEPSPESRPDAPSGATDDAPAPVAPAAEHPVAHGASDPQRERRARLLARRRRMVTTLFVAFAIGAVVAAVAGLAFLWVPALPAALLTLYIGHLRRLERQRYEVKLDRTRAAQAAERLRDRERARSTAPTDRQEPARRPAHDAVHATDPGRPHLRLATAPDDQPETAAAALAEATDHEEWVDDLRERHAPGPDSWEPVPVPLPTYVTAPVAPRVTRGLDLNARDTWDSGRTTDPRNTPLFDQYADPAASAAPAASRVDDDYATRLRAANE
ncbi:divisome protein SepX/GlpR [Kitasatospora sp. McL0602]|uniref:divisome protein SepX/GlpR n=1 Tax=Kitasatospora sp. McL0602 TaxID=3439530 RepID=UPI003F891883